jgi:non-specific serine/threonine protein kinase
MEGSALLLDGGRVRIDPRARQLVIGELPAKLSGRAFDLLLVLARNPDRLVPKQELLDLVWPGLVVEENNLQVHVMTLRRLLGARAIVTVSGRGYRLALTAERADGGGASASAVAPSPDAGLIGREALIAEVAGRLAAGTRLLTLSGPGGAGKTRLALRVAASVAPRLPDGAHAVMLASVRDETHLMPAIAAALDLQERPGVSPDDLVCGFLRPRELLLVLDNCEHLPAAAAAVASMLQACPRLRVLATSRTLLHLGDETEVKVPPLELPAPGADDSPAVRLLLLRASAIGHAIGPDVAARQAAVEICRRLDGLPLAIELAAARLRVLSPMALAARLHQRLALLTGGPADAPARQRTLRDTLAWSHELLAADVQRLLRRLGVFVGGWSLEAAEALDFEPAGTVNRLQALLDHNLVQRVDDVDGQPRYTMLETIREYALEQLARDAEEHRLVADTHARHFLNVMVAAEAQLRSGRRKAALERLRADRNNLRAALARVTGAQPEVETAARMVAASGWWWYFDNGFNEGERWVRAALALSPPPALRAPILAAGARVAVYSAQPALGLERATEAIGLAGSDGDHRTVAATLLVLAVPVLGRSRDESLALVQRSVALYRELADPWGLALAVSYVGVVLAWAPGTETEAEPWLREGRQRFAALGDAWGMSTSTGYMGIVAARRGDHESARRHAEETLAACVEVGDQFRVVGQRLHLAQHARNSGDLPLALRRTDECIAARWAQGHERDTLLLCRWRALLSWEAGRLDEALMLFAVGSNDLDEDASLTGTVASVTERAEWQAALLALRRSQPPTTFSGRWQEAVAQPLGQVLSRLGICDLPPEDSESFRSRP